MTDTKHSPLPWQVRTSDLCVTDAHGFVLAVMNFADKEANAALIVEAVNSHARLKAERDEAVAALCKLVSRADHLFLVPNDRAGTLNCAATSADIAEARALLSRLEDRK